MDKIRHGKDRLLEDFAALVGMLQTKIQVYILNWGFFKVVLLA